MHYLCEFVYWQFEPYFVFDLLNVGWLGIGLLLSRLRANFNRGREGGVHLNAYLGSVSGR